MVQPLDDQYYEQLNEIAAAIQESPALEAYQEEEEDDLYTALRQEFEPTLSELHHKVAAESPLQLVTFERFLLDPLFEGLYLPRVLGYAVLRGEVTDQYRYVRPNDHFKEILLAICRNVHFDQLKKRIGQSISVGFALSSDIWITNLLSQVENKRIRNFLQQQKIDRFREIKDRTDLYKRYSNQFRHELYYSAEFPTSLGEMKANFSALRQFLLKRFQVGGDNSTLQAQIKAFLDNSEFFKTEEYLEMLTMYGNFIVLDEEQRKSFTNHFNRERQNFPEFDERYLSFLATLYELDMVSSECDERMNVMVDRSINDRISDYYRIIEKVHSLGYVHPDAITGVREFYNARVGMSTEVRCLRLVILRSFTGLMKGLTSGEYSDYFNINKIFVVYMRIFDNEEFNQRVRKLSMDYVMRLLRVFTDKRGRDYQDIKRFISTQFVDMKFLDDEDVKEMFKTRRKRRAKTSE
jgi:hypothetical protein